MGAKFSCSCFGFAMGTKASRTVSSESLCSKLKRRIRRKKKRKYSRLIPSSNYDVKISPNRVISANSEELVKIVSVSRDQESNPVIVSSLGKAKSSKRQPAKKKKNPLEFDAAEIKVKSQDAEDKSVKSLESEIYTEELGPKKISVEEEEVTERNLDHRSLVRNSRASRFPTDPNYSQNEQKFLKNPSAVHNVKDTKMSVMEQAQKAQKIRQEHELRFSIPKAFNQLYSKSSRNSGEVDSKSCKLMKSIDFHRKVSSHASAPNSPCKRRDTKLAPLVSSSSYSLLPRSNMAAMRSTPTPNSQPKELALPAALAERKETIAESSGDIKGKGERYGCAINLWVVIIVMGCLVVFSDRVLAIVCASVCWYLIPTLLKKNRALNARDCIKLKRSRDSTQLRGRELNRSMSDVLPVCPQLE